MHLLSRDGRDQLRLTWFDQDVLPHYAILSHTWGEQEVLYQDLLGGSGRDKDGYTKLDFCLRQAAKDGLQYCWVDTCCINRENLAELSEAINSMFRWYQAADKCYVYLSDVPQEGFRSSRWFTRGWTLQELLAPKHVEFFSAMGSFLGDKRSLESDIHERTQIPIEALRGQALAGFGIDIKLSWISRRQTKKEEDMAYSLLGIFGISMSLIYGEGRDRAEFRLRRCIEESLTSTSKVSTDGAFVSDFTLPFALPGAPSITYFTGRVAELGRIQHALPLGTTRETAILHGIGGTGKTQLAIEFAKQRQHDYSAVLWINGRDEVSLQQSFADVARRLNVAHPSSSTLKLAAESDDLASAITTVKHWLNVSQNNRWLLIIDNVDDPHIPGVVNGLYDVWEYLPTTLHGHVLITTRSSNLRIGSQIRVQKILDSQDCLSILRSTSQRPDIEHGTS